MLEFYIKSAQPRRRIVCRNEATYTFLWPYLFSRVMPGARPLCRWAARRGAAVHGALRLQMDDRIGCHMVAARPIKAGRPLLSLPLDLALGVDTEVPTRQTISGQWSALAELSSLVARELHNRRSPHRPYLEFLHDLHNQDNEQVFFRAEADRHRRPSVTQLAEQAERQRLRDEVDRMYGGNAMRMHGVANAPFLDKAVLTSPEQRVVWVRTRDMLRQLEQSVPYFAAKSTAWAVSMVLSRAIRDDESGLSLYPLLDFCTHGFTPNTHLVIHEARHLNERTGVPFHDASRPCIHLVTSTEVQEGDLITRCFSPRPVATKADREFWQMNWGFVPHPVTGS